jgi:hypothetical protein
MYQGVPEWRSAVGGGATQLLLPAAARHGTRCIAHAACMQQLLLLTVPAELMSLLLSHPSHAEKRKANADR